MNSKNARTIESNGITYSIEARHAGTFEPRCYRVERIDGNGTHWLVGEARDRLASDKLVSADSMDGARMLLRSDIIQTIEEGITGEADLKYRVRRDGGHQRYAISEELKSLTRECVITCIPNRYGHGNVYGIA